MKQKQVNLVLIFVIFCCSIILVTTSCNLFKKLKKTDNSGKVSMKVVEGITKTSDFDIAMLKVGVLDGLKESGRDTTILDFLLFDTLDVNIDTISPKLINITSANQFTIDGWYEEQLIVNSSYGKRFNAAPYRIQSLKFKIVNIIKDGKVIKSYKNKTFTKFKIEQYSFKKPDLVKEERDSLLGKINDLESRIKNLRSQIEVILDKQSDHAVQQLPEVLDSIELEFKGIKERYIKKLPQVELLRRDRSKVFSLEKTLKDMEVIVANPEETIKLKSQVLFKSGEYRLTRNNQNSILDEVVTQIEAGIKKLEQKRKNRKINIAIVITGYADDQEINNKTLISDLLGGSYVSNWKDVAVQNRLNKILSDRRASAVNDYIQKQIKAHFALNKLHFIPKIVGKGREKYPDHIPDGSCSGDCLERRVVIISTGDFSTED